MVQKLKSIRIVKLMEVVDLSESIKRVKEAVRKRRKWQCLETTDDSIGSK